MLPLMMAANRMVRLKFLMMVVLGSVYEMYLFYFSLFIAGFPAKQDADNGIDHGKQDLLKRTDYFFNLNAC
jgi:hypothetical protein